MAKKTKKAELEDELGGGIEDEADEAEDDLVKLIEPEPNQNKSGIVVEDYEVGAEVPAVEVPPPAPPKDWKAEKVVIPDGMTASAREQLEAEIKAGRDALKKIKSGG